MEYPNHYQMKKNRLKVLRDANYICQKCGGKAIEIHHLDKTKTNHSKENLMAVCHKCNMSFHRDKIGRPSKYHRLSLKELSLLIGLSLWTIRKYFVNPESIKSKTRRRIEYWMRFA